jgi:hypothetical protein
VPSEAVASMQCSMAPRQPSREQAMAPDIVKLEQISTAVLAAPIQNFRWVVASVTDCGC